VRKRVNVLSVYEIFKKSFIDYRDISDRNDIVREFMLGNDKFFIKRVMDMTYRVVDRDGIFKAGEDIMGKKIYFPRMGSVRKLEDFLKNFVKNGGKIV
jgi:hypothetical protein